LEASFLIEMGGQTLFQRGSRRKSFREPVLLDFVSPEARKFKKGLSCPAGDWLCGSALK
jgi:hypothetical protein